MSFVRRKPVSTIVRRSSKEAACMAANNSVVPHKAKIKEAGVCAEVWPTPVRKPEALSEAVKK